ncbi:MAG: hypothetical protein IPG04_38205 [Polyangiaceae bacterium]|nr:hypothetical protein [Polyangiaceae bacterium]
MSEQDPPKPKSGPRPTSAPPSTREVTSNTISYVDAMLSGRMTDAELLSVRHEILGDAAPPPDEVTAPPPSSGPTALGEGWHVPRLVAPLGSEGEGIDPRLAYVASRIDGQSSIDELVDVVGLPCDETRRVLSELARRGHVVVEAREAPPPRPVALARIRLKRGR